MGDISHRESIRWLPDEASEPTSTIVLTSPERRFVDIRIFKPGLDDAATEPNKPLPLSRLDWALAGFSSSTTDTTPSGEKVMHSVWKHWVDSRTADSDNVQDEGDMVDRPDGSILETGRMVNPATGRETDYEEVWWSEVSYGRGVCAVLKTEDEEKGTRGMMVRLGRWVQGVLRVGERVSVERWVLDSQDGWVCRAKIGEGDGLPVGELGDGVGRLRLGGRVEVEGRGWEVVELELGEA